MTDYVNIRIYQDGISKEDAYLEQKELCELGVRDDGYIHCEDCRQYVTGKCKGFYELSLTYCAGFLKLNNR